MKETDESVKFWEQKTIEAGKEILFKSFSRFIGTRNEGMKNLTGLLYATEDNIYFEDFEKSSMFDFLMKKKRDYEKFMMDFPLSEITEMRRVSESSAETCINGSIKEAKPQGKIMGFFNPPIWEIKLQSENSLFFELFEPDGLVKLVGK